MKNPSANFYIRKNDVERCSIPEVVFFDAADRPHLAHLGARADDFDAHVRARLYDGVLVVRELWRRGVGVPLDV